MTARETLSERTVTAMTTRQATRKTLRAAIAIVLACLIALSVLPAPALAEMAEEAMGEEPVAMRVTERGETRDKDVTVGDAGLTPEEAPSDARDAATPMAELATQDAATQVAELTAQDTVAPDEPVTADVPEEEAAPEGESALSVQSVGRLNNPRVVAKSGANLNRVVTWDCVRLGSYPQTEVPETDALKNATWKDNDATVGGVRYRRISRGDATYVNPSQWTGSTGTYRYFRYEPIKWRILKVEGDTALAVADVLLDYRQYHKADENVTWETSAVRRWLNGMGGPYYSQGAQSGRTAWGFTSVAFTSEQLGAVRQSTIQNANNTKYGTPGGAATDDRVFLLSESEVNGASATAYGFSSDPGAFDEARRCKATDYVYAMGADDNWRYAGCYWWWLRTPGDSASKAATVGGGGLVDSNGYAVTATLSAVRPALKLNVSSPQLTWAGTVSSDGTVDTNAKPGSVPPFSDVNPYAWYASVVLRANDLGIISGYNDGRFGPDDKISRGQVAVVLWNMAGKPGAGSSVKTFSDVDQKAYYYNAVRWASSAGVVSGYKDGRFGPNDNVTREQLAVMLASYAKNVKHKPTSGSAADYASMSDRAKVSSFAVSSVGWCFKSKILSGSDGKINPQGNATRAEAAKMVVGLHDLVGWCDARG